VADGATTITDADCARVSFPNFWDELHAVTEPA
jgi:5-enolpyruvylshikimate-3-phosphate synthase